MLTNGRELQFFNTFLKPDLAAKRILRIDLLAFNAESEFEHLFEQLWQLSRQRMTQPALVRSWLNQRRLDVALRELMTNPGSAVMRHVKRELADRDVAATPQEVSQWFRTHLVPGVVTITAPATVSQHAATQPPHAAGPSAPAFEQSEPVAAAMSGMRAEASRGGAEALSEVFRARIDRAFPGTEWRETKYYVAARSENGTFLAYRVRGDRILVGLTLPASFDHPAIRDVGGEFNWARITKVFELRSEAELSDSIIGAVSAARAHLASDRARTSSYFGVSLGDLVAAGAVSQETQLVLLGNGRRELARASVDDEGFIVWEGRRFRTPSDRTFGALLGRGSSNFNGWSQWHVAESGRFRSLADVRQEYLNAKRGGSSAPDVPEIDSA
ncbi:MAG: hypothetical protein ACR2OO_00210 [Thermomicrobiales bacterium]